MLGYCPTPSPRQVPRRKATGASAALSSVASMGFMLEAEMPSAGLGPATPALGRRRSGPLSYEGMLPAARQREVIIDIRRSGRSSARLECTVRDREGGGANPLAPTPFPNTSDRPNILRHADLRGHHWGRDVVPRAAGTDHLSAELALIRRRSAARCRRGWRRRRPPGSTRRDVPRAARFPRP